MFSARMIDIALRKERLTMRCEGQRAAITQAWQRWQGPARIIDRTWAAACYLRAHPVVLGIGVVAAMIAGRRNLFLWAGRGVVLWRTWRSVAGWVRRFSA